MCGGRAMHLTPFLNKYPQIPALLAELNFDMFSTFSSLSVLIILGTTKNKMLPNSGRKKS